MADVVAVVARRRGRAVEQAAEFPARPASVGRGAVAELVGAFQVVVVVTLTIALAEPPRIAIKRLGLAVDLQVVEVDRQRIALRVGVGDPERIERRRRIPMGAGELEDKGAAGVRAIAAERERDRAEATVGLGVVEEVEGVLSAVVGDQSGASFGGILRPDGRDPEPVGPPLGRVVGGEDPAAPALAVEPEAHPVPRPHVLHRPGVEPAEAEARHALALRHRESSRAMQAVLQGARTGQALDVERRRRAPLDATAHFPRRLAAGVMGHAVAEVLDNLDGLLDPDTIIHGIPSGIHIEPLHALASLAAGLHTPEDRKESARQDTIPRNISRRFMVS